MDRLRIEGPFAVVSLRLAPARWQRALLAAAHLLSIAPVWLSDIGRPLAVALTLALLVALRAALRRLGPAAPQALRMAQLLPDGSWRVTFTDGRQADAVLDNAVVGESGWCLLRLRAADGRVCTELVHAGRCDRQSLRRLRVRLRLDPLAAPGAATLRAGDDELAQRGEGHALAGRIHVAGRAGAQRAGLDGGERHERQQRSS